MQAIMHAITQAAIEAKKAVVKAITEAADMTEVSDRKTSSGAKAGRHF